MADEKDEGEANYELPASQVDLQARLENGNKSDRILSTADIYEAPEDDENARDYRVEGNDTENYLNVDPMYQNYANDTEAPHLSEEGPEADLEDLLRGESESEDQPDEDEAPLNPTKSTVTRKQAASPSGGGTTDESKDSSSSTS